jgi:hypothetical protein
MKLVDAMGNCPPDGAIGRRAKPEQRILKSMPKFYEMPPTLPDEDRRAEDWAIYE